MELYIIRHAQSANNVIEDIAGYESQRVSDPPLTELGLEQAQLVADYLAGNLQPMTLKGPNGRVYNYGAGGLPKLTHLYCSAMHRALQTTQPIAQALNLIPEVWLELHEQGGIFLQESSGIVGYPGMTRSQILESFTDYKLPDTITEQGWWKPESGYEDVAVTMGRAVHVATNLRQRAQGSNGQNERIGIVTHGTFIDLLMKALLNMLPGDFTYFNHNNTAITRIDFKESGRLALRYVNRTAHLPSEMVS